MKTTPEELYNKIQKLSEAVKQDLRGKGLVVPVKHKDGSTSIGSYRIVKGNSGYTILDHSNDVVVDHINLPQTAILVANKLALGYYKDTELIVDDKQYGYADFEEELYKRAIKSKSLANIDIYMSKYGTAHIKKAIYKRRIINSFEKLIRLV